MEAFDFYPTARVVFGEGTLAQLGKLSEELGGSRILFVTDPGIVSAGLADRAIAVLQRASLDFFVFDSVGENPTTAHIEAGVVFAKARGNIDLIVGMGGGSAMDCAKGNQFYPDQRRGRWKIIRVWAMQQNPCCSLSGYQRPRARGVKRSPTRLFLMQIPMSRWPVAI